MYLIFIDISLAQSNIIFALQSYMLQTKLGSEILYNNIKMISLGTLFLTIFILLALTIAYKVIKQYKFKTFFAKQAQALGYKVYEHPYCWFSSKVYTMFKTQQKQYGDAHYHYKHELSKPDLIVSNLLFRTMVELVNPEVIKEFYLKANEGYYIKADYGLGHLRRLIGVQNLLLSEGDYWKNRRKVLSSVFNYDFITNQIPEIQRITQTALDNLQKTNTDEDNKSLVYCNVVNPLLQVFSTVILKCFFKGDLFEYVGKQSTVDFIQRIILKITQIGRSKAGVLLGVKFAQLGLTETNRKINTGVKQFREVARKIVEKRIKQVKEAQKNEIKQEKANTKYEDIIQALMKNKEAVLQGEKENPSKETISIDSIINQFVTFFLAGSQTTLAFTRMMIYRLVWHPDVLQKIREEFEREANTPEITLNQLKNLKYFQKVQNQVLRMDSSVGGIFMRIATKDHYLGKLKIYKDTVIMIRLRALHYKQTEYPSANQFNPDRWDEKASSNNYTYIPFSAGARNCIGKHLALLQNKIFMIEFLRRYKNIVVSKSQKQTHFMISGLYGPQDLVTRLTKSK